MTLYNCMYQLLLLYRPGSEHMYGFSEFTCSLNEPEPGLCPTDSRLRPDQRTMENGDYDNANIEKVSMLYVVDTISVCVD